MSERVRRVALLGLWLTVAMHTRAADPPTASAVATATQATLSPATFHRQWNALVGKLAGMGTPERARQLNDNLLLGDIAAASVMLSANGAWMAQSGDGDRIWFTAASPQTVLTRVVVQTPAAAIQTGPARIAPAVMWTMSFFRADESEQAIQQQAVHLMQGLARQTTSIVQDGTDRYTLSIEPDGALRFDAQRNMGMH